MKPPAQCSFNLAPVGAGAFMVESYKPDDSIKMVRNPNFFGRPAYLDSLTFLDKGDAGGQATYEFLKAGTTQAAFLRDPAAVAQAKVRVSGVQHAEPRRRRHVVEHGRQQGRRHADKSRHEGLEDTAGDPISHRCERSERPWVSGQRTSRNRSVPVELPMEPGHPGPKYDLDTAKRLVSEAKAAGWNGNLNVLFSTGLKDVGQAVTTMLQAGIGNATLDLQESTAEQNVVTTTKDFEAAYWGISVSPDDYAIFALAPEPL